MSERTESLRPNQEVLQEVFDCFVASDVKITHKQLRECNRKIFEQKRIVTQQLSADETSTALLLQPENSAVRKVMNNEEQSD